MKLNKSEVVRAVKFGFSPERVHFWRCRINGLPPCSNDDAARLMASHERIVSRARKALTPAAAIEAKLINMHIDFPCASIENEGVFAWYEEQPTWDVNAQTWNDPDNDDWRRIYGPVEEDHLARPLKVLERYDAQPPAARRKARTAWEEFTFALGKAPETLFGTRHGYYVYVRDFRGLVIHLRLDNFTDPTPEE